MPFGSLWLPVVVSTVAVFVVSTVLHAVLKYHNADYRKLPDEDAVGEAMRKHPASPGLYVIPHCVDAMSMKDPAVVKKYETGPVALIAVLRSGPPNLGRQLALWFGLCLLISFTTAYVARHTLSVASDGLSVMRITGTVAFVAYGYGFFHDSIWAAVPWANSIRALLDAAIYAIVTGLAFRLLWPGV